MVMEARGSEITLTSIAPFLNATIWSAMPI
jgi:hypothetical protein